MTTWERIRRHARITAKTYRGPSTPPSPPFLILFINSICNQTCEHCFYWRSLNQPDDLSVEELRSVSAELGQVENMNLSGGEPFLRKEFAEICSIFIRGNGVRQIYVPTNGSFADRTLAAVEVVLREKTLDLFAVELSLDGMPEYHDRFRGMKDAFARAMETYRVLADLQRRDPRLRIHSASTANADNIAELGALTRYLYENCPAMDHHNLALIQGDRKNASLNGPALEQYRQLYELVRRTWAPREESRYGSIVEPMLQCTKTRTLEARRQVVPCTAGILSAVIYANGGVGVCQEHPPLGNLRQKSFCEMWYSPEAEALRRSIAAKECWCTNEVFMWPSIVYQPLHLATALVRSNLRSQPGAMVPDPAPQFPILK
jgi:MoaA/NifB/PqqE/SkfB family radical SAM enzyme